MSRHPEDKHTFNEATRKLKDNIKIIKEETFQTHLRSLTATSADTDYSLWSNQTIKTTHITHPISHKNAEGPEPIVIRKKRKLLQDT
jgi:hypothetical protein